MSKLGVHSEVGKLHTVMVCRPGLAHQRLTPGNAADLLFDDMLWVPEAQRDHHDFVLKMRDKGTEVIDLHEMLAETLQDKAARAWVLERRLTVNDVGLGVAPLRAWLEEIPAPKLAEHLIGGIAVLDVPKSEWSKMLEEAYGGTEFLLPPVPNTLFQRDPSCWIYGGVTVNPMYWPARQPETLLQRAVYKFHPRFKADGGVKIWWGDSDAVVRRVVARRRRRDADRQGHGVDRHGRAHHASGGVSSGRKAVRAEGRRARDRLPDAQEPRRDAPGHRVQLLRPRSRHRLPRGGRPGALLQLPARRQGRHRGACREGTPVRRRARCARA